MIVNIPFTRTALMWMDVQPAFNQILIYNIQFLTVELKSNFKLKIDFISTCSSFDKTIYNFPLEIREYIHLVT